MANTPTQRWRKARIKPLDIALDRDNPRINVEANDKESDIIRKLIKYEDVQDLARRLRKPACYPENESLRFKRKGNGSCWKVTAAFVPANCC